MALQRLVIGPASHGEDRNVLLVTLGLSIVIENLLLGDLSVRHAHDRHALRLLDARSRLRLPAACRRRSPLASPASSALALWALLSADRHRQGDPRGRQGANSARRWSASMSRPYLSPSPSGSAPPVSPSPPACCCRPSMSTRGVGERLCAVAFTIVVLGGMGSVPGALIGGLVIGVVESLSGLYFGDSLGQLGIFLIFILVLLLRPTRPVRSDAHDAAPIGRSFCTRACARGDARLADARRTPSPTAHGDGDDRRARRPWLEPARRLWRTVSPSATRPSSAPAPMSTRVLQARYGVNAYVAFRLGVVAGALVGARDRLSQFPRRPARLLFRAGYARLRRGLAHPRQRRADHRRRGGARCIKLDPSLAEFPVPEPRCLISGSRSASSAFAMLLTRSSSAAASAPISIAVRENEDAAEGARRRHATDQTAGDRRFPRR